MTNYNNYLCIQAVTERASRNGFTLGIGDFVMGERQLKLIPIESVWGPGMGAIGIAGTTYEEVTAWLDGFEMRGRINREPVMKKARKKK